MRGRGSAGGGQSSLGYLFGGEKGAPGPPQPSPKNPIAESLPKAYDASPQADNDNDNKAFQTGASNYTTNNYHRANGQNRGNFITARPSTKVNSAPGGASSLNYLFGDGSNKK